MIMPSSIIHPPSSSGEQRELPLATTPVNTDVQWLEHLLQGAKCWMTAKDVELTSMGRVGDRDIRRLASASGWIISGDKGYKHLENATLEEAQHFANRLRSQAKQMDDRAGLVLTNAHRRIG